MIKIIINDQEIQCETGQTILEVALKNNIFIPTLCEHPDFDVKANCRVCIVEIIGKKTLTTACSTKVEDGMIVATNTKRVQQARNLNIEMLFAEHIEKCPTCIWRINCQLLDLASRYKILITTFKDRKNDRPIFKFENAVELDATQCIDCRNCVDACSKMQKINYLEIDGKGSDQIIKPTQNKKISCILCGQCTVHCPVGSAQEQADWDKVENTLKDENKINIALVSWASLVSLKEEFKEITTEHFYEKVVTALKLLGFKYVFNDGLYRIIWSLKVARQITDKTIINSDCPSAVKFINDYYPELKDLITSVKSPAILWGEIIKTVWAEEKNINSSNINTVFISPCTASKYEIIKNDKEKNFQAIDFSITIRELSWIIKKNKIDFNFLKNKSFDKLIAKDKMIPAIGVVGDEAELVLKSLIYLSGYKKDVKIKKNGEVDFKKSNILTLETNFLEQFILCGVVNGVGEASRILKDIEKYNFLEIKSCPGGCIGGGGQIIPTNDILRKERALKLKKINEKIDFKKIFKEIEKWLKEKNLI